MLNLDLGGGGSKIEGWECVDMEDWGQKYVINIEKEGLKAFEDNSVDGLRAFNFLEHISMDRELFVMNECHRVLKPGGLFHIKVPKFPHYNAVVDPTHKSFWVPRKFTNYYAGKRPRNAVYRDHEGTPMQKWAIDNENGEYRMEIDYCSIDIWLKK